MHHGYYIPEDRTDHQQAQIDLIDEVLKWAGAEGATNMVDVGCGIGGSSRHIAAKFGCKAQGITLSPYQANRGNELAIEQGLADQASFQVSDIQYTINNSTRRDCSGCGLDCSLILGLVCDSWSLLCAYRFPFTSCSFVLCLIHIIC